MASTPTFARPAAARAVVTGAAQGIGLACAERLVDDGSTDLVVLDRNADGLEAAATALRARRDGVAVRTVVADLADIEAATAALLTAVGEGGEGGIDVLVNAAGITSRGGLDDIDVATFDRLIAINARAPLFVVQALRSRFEPGATVVNIASMLAHGGPPFLLGYAASKAALVTLTKGMANTLKRERIRVFAINLGWTLTPAEQEVQTRVHGLAEDWADDFAAAQPFGRLLMPEDPAGLVSFLASPDARMMTGAIIDLDQFVAGTVTDNPGAAT